MRRFFRNLPIGRKLTILTTAISGTALLIACAVFAAYQRSTDRQTTARDFAILGDIFDDNVASGLAFNDGVAIGKTLKTLRAHHSIVAAGVYDINNFLVAQYRRSGGPDDFVFPKVPLAGQRFFEDRLDTFQEVVLAGETIGMVYIAADLSALRERAVVYTGIIGGLLFVCSLVAFVLTAGFQRIISGPIEDLARTVATVAAEKNYAVRAHKQSDDELGRLIDGFNEMLAQIQVRDVDLRRAHDELENRVRERTGELLQAQAEVAREKDRLQLIFESVPVGICLDNTSASGARNRLLNRAHLTICGLERDTAADDDIFQRLTHPDDVPRQNVLLRQLEAGTIPRFSTDKRYIRPDGQTVWVALSMQRENHADGSWQELSTIVDITELKSAQETAARERARFKFIFDSVPVGISLTVAGDATTRIVNPAHERMTGISQRESIQPDAFERISDPQEYCHQMKLAESFIRGEVDRYSLEKRYLHSDGRTVWAALTRRNFTDPVSGVEQSITTLVDITDRKQAETTLAETHRQLLDASRKAGMAEVATGVLHNVGNVLNSVNVSATLVADILRESKVENLAKVGVMLQERAADAADFLTTDPRGRKIPAYLVTLAKEVAAEHQLVTDELGHLRKNIDHIKDIVAMQQSHARTSGLFETLAVSDIIDDALRMNAGSLARHDVQTVRDYQARPTITTDKHKLIQILVNLVRNAKHACDDAGRVEKKILVRTTADERGVTIAVIDNGVGIPPENLTRIFAHGFTTRKHGHGFGLHSGALAAKQLSGDLSVQSDGPGHGATFTLWLPYAPKGVAA